MKNILVFLIIIIFGFSSIGVNIIKHTCKLCGVESDKIEIFSLADNDNCCDVLGAEKNCSNNTHCCHSENIPHSDSKNNVFNDSCCKFSNIFIKLKILISQYKLSVSDFNKIVDIFFIDNFSEIIENKSLPKHNFLFFKILKNTDLILKHCHLTI